MSNTVLVLDFNEVKNLVNLQRQRFTPQGTGGSITTSEICRLLKCRMYDTVQLRNNICLLLDSEGMLTKDFVFTIDDNEFPSNQMKACGTVVFAGVGVNGLTGLTEYQIRYIQANYRVSDVSMMVK